MNFSKNSVHATTGIDASSSPSPPSTYSPQSSPSESRTSPNAAAKQQSTKFSNSGSTASSHHNDLPGGGGGGTNRLNGKFLSLSNQNETICFFSADFTLNSGSSGGESNNFLPWHTSPHPSLAAALQMNTLPLG